LAITETNAVAMLRFCKGGSCEIFAFIK